MKSLMIFHEVAFDSRLIRAGTTFNRGDTLKFFDTEDTENDADVVTKQHEEALVRWLVDSPARELILTHLGARPDSFVACGVKHPVVESPQSKPGDIDLMVCDLERPDRTIGLQCKRVKVTAHSQDEDDVNRLPDVGGGVRQANLQRDKFGFYRNYLAVLIEVDGRARTQSNVLFRGTTQKTFSRIYDFPHRERLHEDVGVIFVEVSQPTGKSFTDKAVVSICIDHEAARLEQPTHLTNRIKEYILRNLSTTRQR